MEDGDVNPESRLIRNKAGFEDKSMATVGRGLYWIIVK